MPRKKGEVTELTPMSSKGKLEDNFEEISDDVDEMIDTDLEMDEPLLIQSVRVDRDMTEVK